MSWGFGLCNRFIALIRMMSNKVIGSFLLGKRNHKQTLECILLVTQGKQSYQELAVLLSPICAWRS